ncbi:MAG: tyrosine-type recombinase/integrase [Nitrospinae bacterium]|nr:tyrosine-type recombinase/integrase [Nitrospinota bacterium]
MTAKPMIKTLSSRAVAKLVVGKDTVFWDRDLTGFGVRVYPTGSKVYVAQARGPEGPKRVAVGRHGVIHAEEARKRAALVIARIKAGEEAVPKPLNPAGGPTVAELARRYLDEYVSVRCKPRTVKTVRSVVRRHIVPALGKFPLAAVERAHVAEMHQRLSATPAVANQAVRSLSAMYKLAESWELAPDGLSNPCRAITEYPGRRRERFLTEAELERLGRALDEVETGGRTSSSAVAAIRLLILTGCRKSEILTLRWEEVALDQAELRLSDSKTGARVVSLSEPAVKLLAGLPRLPGVPWVIPGRKPGAHLSKLDDAWQSVRSRADLHDVRLHDLRHSFASRALALGEGLPMIGKLLGHARIETTSRYAHLARDSVRASAERVAASIEADLLGANGNPACD